MLLSGAVRISHLTSPLESAGTMETSRRVFDVEKGDVLERYVTPGGHPVDFSQPAFPRIHVSQSHPSSSCGEG